MHFKAFRRALQGLWVMVLLAFPAMLPMVGAPQGRMAFRAFGAQDGLNTLTAWALQADQAGFMWAATEDGLYRFDGNRFKAFGSKDGLPSHFIWCLHQDPDGVLWAGTFKGLARQREDHFETVPLGPDGFAPEIAAIQSGPQNQVWVATSAGPFRQAPDGGFQPVPGWPGGAATALWARPDSGQIWVASWADARPRVWRWAQGAWTEVQGPRELAEGKLDALAVDGEQRVWARSISSLWQLGAQDHAFHPVLPAIPATQQRGNLFVDRTGCLWVTTSKGLVRFTREGPQWLTPDQGLPGANLATLAQDRQGTLWLAGAGVYHQLGGGAWRSYAQGTGLPAGSVWVIFRDRDGVLFAGTDRGLFQEGPERWQLVPGTAGVQVRTIVQAPDRTMYLAGSPEILRWGPHKGAFTHFGAEQGVVTGGRIYRLLLAPDGALWVGTGKGGLLRGDTQGGRMAFKRVDLPLGDPGEDFLDLCLDPSGRLWASGDRGLLVLDRGQWHRFTTRDGLRNDHVSFLHANRDGHLVFAYFERLGVGQASYDSTGFHLDKHLDDIIPVDKVIYQLGEDAQGRLWIGSGQGLDRIEASGRVEHFGLGDGLVTEDTNSQAFLAESSGDVWIGTSFGLERFLAGQDLGFPKPPACVILTCKLGGKPVPVVGLRERTIPSRTSGFEAEFTGLSFVKGSEINYQTRMLGLESEWHATETREVRYPALAPGSYRFEVRARIGHDQWGEPAGLDFKVLPALWQTWWFKLLEGCCVLGLAALAFWVRVAALHRRNRHLEDMVARRTQELANANEQLKNQSLTDPLTGLKNRRFLGMCMPEDVAQINRVHHSASRENSRMAVNIDMVFIMVDLDHFKDVNDHYGHAAGDLVLQEVAQILRRATRDSDTIVRWGGEEFLIVARNAAREEATILMERILTQVGAHAFVLEDGREIHCTCSLGFTFYPFLQGQPEILPWEKLLDLADHCLYAAKRGGRNAWVGLYPALDADPKLLAQRIPSGIGELIWRHQVVARTSLAADVVLEWDGSA